MKATFLILALAAAGVSHAAPPVNSVEDLRVLEQKVKAVVAKKTGATISLVSPRGASGSGVIISPDGLILTAAHVSSGSKEMTVIFADGRQETAKILGSNYTRDASMAQLVGDGPWPYANVGSSDKLKVGDFVVAMGHPKGYDPTRRPPVRFGRVVTKGEYGFVTTDCTLIGGDSGGPLFDLEGNVIGIHSHIAPQRQVNNHAGVSGYVRSWKKMLNGDTWGRLGGIPYRDRNRPVFGVQLSEDDGVTVMNLTEKSPAFVAGLRKGDVLKKIEGEAISHAKTVSDLLIDREPGDEVKVVVERDGAAVTRKVTLASLAQVYQFNRR